MRSVYHISLDNMIMYCAVPKINLKSKVRVHVNLWSGVRWGVVSITLDCMR